MARLARPIPLWSRPRPFGRSGRRGTVSLKKAAGRLPAASMVWRRKKAAQRPVPASTVLSHATTVTQVVNHSHLSDAPREAIRLAWLRQKRLTTPGAMIARVERTVQRVISVRAEAAGIALGSTVRAAPVAASPAIRSGQTQAAPRAPAILPPAEPRLTLSFRNWAASPVVRPLTSSHSSAPAPASSAASGSLSSPSTQNIRTRVDTHRHVTLHRTAATRLTVTSGAHVRGASASTLQSTPVGTTARSAHPVPAGKAGPAFDQAAVREVDLDWRKPAEAVPAASAEPTPDTMRARSPQHAVARPPSGEPLRSVAQLDPSLVSRLTDDVIQRIERRARIERERRGL